MSVDGATHAPTALVQRLLLNRQVGGRPRALPVVVLLGPSGSGKSTVLDAVSRDCGGGVVHAKVDFDQIQASDVAGAGAHLATVEALTRLVGELSRAWRGRPDPRFHRFTLSLLAAQASLTGRTGAERRREMGALIDQLTTPGRGNQVADTLKVLAATAKNFDILSDAAANAVQAVLPRLVKALQRRPLEHAARWFARQPEAEGAVPRDALVRLNTRVHDDPLLLGDALADAFMADVRENHARMAVADQHSSCACGPEARQHWHNWVLLLDNIDQESGREFVATLLRARTQGYGLTDHDPLLIVATSGRWIDEWDAAWLPVWKQSDRGEHAAHPVPSVRSTTYATWSEVVGEPTAPPEPGYSPYLPVLLEPLQPEEIGGILDTDHELTWQFVRQATGGLPGAVQAVKPMLRGVRVQPSYRDALIRSRRPGGPESGPDPEAVHDAQTAREWRDQLVGHLRTDGVDVDGFIDAAPFATAPWLMPDSATSLIDQQHVGQILTELRTALWVTVPKEAGGTAQYAVLHPWIAGALTAALSFRDENAPRPTYRQQYEVLLRDPDTAEDPARAAYCRLALSTQPFEITEIAAEFARRFDRAQHAEWIRQIKLAARAPARFGRRATSWELYTSLADVNDSSTDRADRIEIAVRRLLTAEWLNTDPFAVPDRVDLRRTIHHEYAALAGLSQRADVRELRMAATNAANWRL